MSLVSLDRLVSLGRPAMGPSPSRSSGSPPQAPQAAKLDLFRRGWGCQVPKELAGLRLGQVPLGQVADGDPLPASHWPGYKDLVAYPNLPMRLGALVVHLDLAALARLLSL